MTELPIFTIVVAMTADRLIGNHGHLPWHHPEELKGFRDLTLGGTLIMGCKTCQSLPASLPGRTNIVVSSNLSENRNGFLVLPELFQALQKARELGAPIFVIGGGQLFEAALPHAERMVVSWMRGRYSGDTFFPPVFANEWRRTSCTHSADFSRCHYLRRRAKKIPGLHGEPGMPLLPPWKDD